MRSTPDNGRVTAVLGPTNTGKTHLAIERMLGHSSGMIGFPLRLLARENYDRIVRLKGRHSVALITGEEKIIPPHPSWFICTVESMPLDRSVAFLAIDEVQLAADPERGHIFTQRILHARGREETMLLGSDTIGPLLKRLVPDAEIISRPRFSTLTYVGPQKVTRLPPRSAVVAFSIADVFELAELVRRHRGGTAVVLGALSPRARNAQVAMFEAGEVDYMVATDAIGMGLNMDLNHVAFARLNKFDGRGPRRLSAPEVAQIAGRAGRHMNDGTFGTTAEIGPMPDEIVAAVENHRFDPLTALWWRNERLDFRSGAMLLKSLDAPAPQPILLRVAEADDHVALTSLLRQEDIAAIATNPARVRLLWEICQIPDFRKVMSEHHSRLLGEIYRYLTGPDERLPKDWVAQQLERLNRLDGDIDTLVQRIAHVRTWTYITHRGGWVADCDHWQEVARALEDRLSDTLHDRITQRFVDRRSALLVRHLNDPRKLLASVSQAGEVQVEGHFVGTLHGFRFRPDPTASGQALPTLMAAANRVLRQEIETRAHRLTAAPDNEFELAGDGTVIWKGHPVARLTAGATMLTPKIEPLAAEFLDGAVREAVRRRLHSFIRDRIARELPGLQAPSHKVAGAASGLLFRLSEGLGMLDSRLTGGLTRSLGDADRKMLTRLGVRFGTETTYFESLLKPAAILLRAQLWAAFNDDWTLPVPQPGRLSVPCSRDQGAWPTGYGEAIGYRVLGPRAIRLDRLEQLGAGLRKAARADPPLYSAALGSIAGIPAAELPQILQCLGYDIVETEGIALLRAARPSKQTRKLSRKARHSSKPVLSDNPFAKLKELAIA